MSAPLMCDVNTGSHVAGPCRGVDVDSHETSNFWISVLDVLFVP